MMKYDDVFHEYIELMVQNVGYTPNHYEHHVMVRVHDHIGFAYYSRGIGWMIPAVYQALEIETTTDLVKALSLAIEEYAEQNPDYNKPPELQRMPMGEAYAVINEAKNDDTFEIEKWGDE